MNSRQRLLTAANHQEPDRVPLDFGATRSGGITAIAYNALTAHLGIKAGPPRLFDIQQQLVWPDDAILDRYGVDVIDVGRAFLTAPGDWRPCRLNDGSAAVVPTYYHCQSEADGSMRLYTARGTLVGVKPASSFYVDQNRWPWKDLPALPDPVPVEEFDEQLWAVPSPPYHLDILRNPADLKQFAETVRDLHATTDRALLLDFGIAGFFEAPGYMRGLENWFCDLLADAEGTARMLDAYEAMCLERLDVILGAVGDAIDVLRLFWDDMGSQQTTQLSPQLFRKTFAPRYRRLIDFIHSKSNCRVLVHSCGSIYRILPYLIEAGVEMLNPIQTSCAEMDPRRLKKEFGRDLVFWGGGCDTVGTLTSGTPQQVRDQVKERIEIFGEGGGFVFVQTHNLQPGVPPENVAAMLEAVAEYGEY